MSRRPAPDATLQLDIFADSRDVVLRNQVAAALEAGDAAAARAACDALADEFGNDEVLAPARCLADALERAAAPVVFTHHDALAIERRRLDADLAPAAHRVLGRAAGPWLAAHCRALARRAQRLAFDAGRPDEHAAPLWLRAGDWIEAEEAVAAIESWRRIPVPLAWMVEARLHAVGLAPTWPLLAELAWLAPRRLDELVRRAPEPQLVRFVQGFERGFDGEGEPGDLAWFPAWMLTQRPELRDTLAAAQPSRHAPPEQALRLLVELLGLERQGRQREIVERRQSLRELNPALYAAYLATR